MTSVQWAMSRTSPSLLTILSRPDTFQPTPGLTVSPVESALTTGRESLKVGYIVLILMQTFNFMLTDLKVNTTMRVEEAENVKITGAAGAYTAAFENMESQIAEINKIIERSSLKNEELASFSNQIEAIEAKLDDTGDRMKSLDNSLTNTEQAILQGQYNLTTLRKEADNLHMQAAHIKDKATQLQEVICVLF